MLADTLAQIGDHGNSDPLSQSATGREWAYCGTKSGFPFYQIRLGMSMCASA